MDPERIRSEQTRREPVIGDSKNGRTRVASVSSWPLTLHDAHSPAVRFDHGFGSSQAPATNGLQAKLTINESGDQYEQEADRIAEQVMRMPDTALRVQRKCGCGESTASGESCGECASPSVSLQRLPVPDAKSGAKASDIVHEVLRAPGHPFSQNTRDFFEQRFAQDFSNVRIHNDERAAQAARAVGARAYTVGRDVVFGSGQYSPHTLEGSRLLAHELTHTMQQRSMTVPHQIQRDAFTPAPGQLGRETGRVTPAGPLSVIDVTLDRTVTCGYVFHLRLQFDRSNCRIVSPMPVQFLHPADPSKRLRADQFNALADRFVSVANTRLNGWYALRITGAAPGCNAPCRDQEMPIQVQVTRSTATTAHPITLINDSGRSDAGHLYAGDVDEWTLWHEAGHVALGISDEYREAGVACREGSHANEGDWSLMASSDQFRARAVLHPRHFSHILTWFQREYPTCQVSLPALARSAVLDTLLHFEIGGGSFANTPALYGSASLQRGFPLDAARRFRLMVGGRFSAFSAPERTAILAGLTLGIDANTNRSAGGFEIGADVSGGAGAMWPVGTTGSRPWAGGGAGTRGVFGLEAGAHLGYAGPQIEFGLTGRAGALQSTGGTDPYFMMGLRFGAAW